MLTEEVSMLKLNRKVSGILQTPQARHKLQDFSKYRKGARRRLWGGLWDERTGGKIGEDREWGEQAVEAEIQLVRLSGVQMTAKPGTLASLRRLPACDVVCCKMYTFMLYDLHGRPSCIQCSPSSGTVCTLILHDVHLPYCTMLLFRYDTSYFALRLGHLTDSFLQFFFRVR
jgi:hypothetical protein